MAFSDHKSLQKQLIGEYGKEKANSIFVAAEAELNCLLQRFPDIPKGERTHTDNYIFPRVALYRVLKKEFGEEAMVMIDDVIHVKGTKMGSLLRKITSLPLMEKLFLRIFAFMAKNMFGEKNGFRQSFYTSPKGIVKFDILDCVYCRYCRLCDCPELIHTFCDSDAYCFGNLSKIEFAREQTLENGEKCDFTLTIRGK